MPTSDGASDAEVDIPRLAELIIFGNLSLERFADPARNLVDERGTLRRSTSRPICLWWGCRLRSTAVVDHATNGTTQLCAQPNSMASGDLESFPLSRPVKARWRRGHTRSTAILVKP
jgi:hypothetical protein